MVVELQFQEKRIWSFTITCRSSRELCINYQSIQELSVTFEPYLKRIFFEYFSFRKCKNIIDLSNNLSIKFDEIFEMTSFEWYLFSGAHSNTTAWFCQGETRIQFVESGEFGETYTSTQRSYWSLFPSPMVPEKYWTKWGKNEVGFERRGSVGARIYRKKHNNCHHGWR